MESMDKQFLLSNDEHLTPNIEEGMVINVCMKKVSKTLIYVNF